MSRSSALVSLTLAALVAPACSTTWAEIDGPRVGVGISIDHDLRVSPRFEVGWDYDQWNNALGGGVSGTMAWSPAVGRVEAVAEARFLAFPLVSIAPLTPTALGTVLAWSRDEGLTLAFRAGLGTLMYMPPEACFPPLEGDWQGCPPGARLPEDVVHRPWLPRLDYRFSIAWSLEERDRVIKTHLLSFAITGALATLAGSAP